MPSSREHDYSTDMKLLSLFSFVSLLSLAGLSACGGSARPAEESGMEHGPVPAGPVVPAGEAKVGDKTKCPVSGEEFVVRADSPKVEHAGKTYYFCCAHCVQKFQANPEKYTGS